MVAVVTNSRDYCDVLYVLDSDYSVGYRSLVDYVFDFIENVRKFLLKRTHDVYVA